jgi:putative CocE/NonD family hydrolase
MRKWMKRIALGFAALVALAVAVLAVLILRVQFPGEQMTPAGIRCNTAVYLKMRDGVEIAVDIWLPSDLKPGERLPVLMRTTRYWRARRLGWGLRLLVALRQVHTENLVNRQRAYFNGRRFVVITVDARGSGASGGQRAVEYSPDEVADLGEVAAWAARQPWSNVRVGTFGVSYDGNTAELAAVPNQPAV